MPGHHMDLFAHACGAGESDAVHIHVRGQRRAGLGAKARHHVKYPIGNTGLQRQVGQAQRREWRFFAGFEHHAVAHGQRRRDLPGRHDHRVVPGHHHAHHTHRLTRDEGQRGISRGCNFVVHLVYRLAVPADTVGSTVHVHRAGVLHGLAHVHRFGQGQCIGVFQQQVGKLDHDAFALRRRQAAPAFVVKSRAGGAYRSVNVGRTTLRHLGQHAPVHRRDTLESGTTQGGHTLAANHGAPIKLQLAHVVLVVVCRLDGTVGFSAGRFRPAWPRRSRAPACASAARPTRCN